MAFLKDKLDHSRAAYRYAVKSLPDKAPHQENGFLFERDSQVVSMLIEFGWAFFCRYEGCFEAHIKEHGIVLSKKLSLLDWLNQNGAKPTEDQKHGLELYRKIRNKLHHEDGKSFDDTDDNEIHLLPDHMENYYQLFLWCGEFIETSTVNKPVVITNAG